MRPDHAGSKKPRLATAAPRGGVLRAVVLRLEQFRQLGEVRRHAPRLVYRLAAERQSSEKSDRAITEEVGLSKDTVRRAETNWRICASCQARRVFQL